MSAMNKRKILGRFELADVSLYVTIGVATLGAFAGLFVDNTKLLTLSFLLLLGAVAWDILALRRQPATTHEELRAALREELHTALGKMEVALVRESDDVFRQGRLALQEGKWQRVYIYAPVGLWDMSKEKDPWLKDLQQALIDKRVKRFRGVYGLPPNEAAAWARAKDRLQLFRETPRTEIHYLPPQDREHPTAAPGLGWIIFENTDEKRYKVIFAFVGHATEEGYERNGFAIQNEQIVPIVASWFDQQLFDPKSHCFVLRGRDPDSADFVKFDEVLASIEQRYYTPLNTSSPI
jgi:hypothetical protein